jgi:ABC-type multidrug transport system ATPase subunit
MNVLEIENVSKRFKAGNYGVKDFTLNVPNGVLGLLGPNGAGKTTLMQMIATITRPTAGRILFQGTDIIRNPEFLRQRLGYLPQDFGIYENLTSAEFKKCWSW